MEKQFADAAIKFLDAAKEELGDATTEEQHGVAMGLAHTACKLAEMSAALAYEEEEEK